ncbi:MAG: peptidoglycan-binding protein [Clostridia bacterium]|nr:peptidoglycan-binding protein [Clostridia bacterium]
MREDFFVAKIIVFNNDTNRMENYYRGEADPMPYNTNGTLRVREFRGSSRSNILWTTKRTMQSWNSQRYIYGRPIPVGFAFKRPYEGGHGNQSQHYAGVAFDVGQTLTQTQRNALWNSAKNSGVWAYVEPLSITPTWVHFDKRFGTPACPTGGYPQLKRGSISNYVCIAQDDLNTLGFSTGGLDGIFGLATQNAVSAYQRRKGLAADGIVGCNTWRALQEDVVGTGSTNTTIN